MPDFKEGDVVRCLSDTANRVPVGSVGVVVRAPGSAGVFDVYVRWFDDTLGLGPFTAEQAYPMCGSEVEHAQ